MEQALYGTMPRKMAETFVLDAGPSQEELALAKQQAENDANMLAQNSAMYQENPIPYEVDNAIRTSSPDEVDDAIKQLGNEEPMVEEDNSIEVLDMAGQTGSINPDMAGMTPELAGYLANGNSL